MSALARESAREGPAKWECRQCTFLNPSEHLQCICGAVKGNAAGAAPVPAGPVPALPLRGDGTMVSRPKIEKGQSWVWYNKAFERVQDSGEFIEWLDEEPVVGTGGIFQAAKVKWGMPGYEHIPGYVKFGEICSKCFFLTGP